MTAITPVSPAIEGYISLTQANEIHRLHHEDCLTATQIARVTGISLSMVSGVLVGRTTSRWPRGDGRGCNDP